MRTSAAWARPASLKYRYRRLVNSRLYLVGSGPLTLSQENNPVPPPLLFSVRFANSGNSDGIEVAPDWEVNGWLQLRGSYSYLNLDRKNLSGSADRRTVTSDEGSGPPHEFRGQALWICPVALNLSLVGQNLLAPRQSEFGGGAFMERALYAKNNLEQMNHASPVQRVGNGGLRHHMPNALLLCAALLLSLFSALVQAQPSKPTEYDVKAAYLYNFGKFVRWPESVSANTGRFFICLVGNEPLTKSLDSILQGATWEGKPVTAKPITTVDEVSACHVLFISSSRAEQWSQFRPVIQRLPILTVSDTPRFAQRNGMIELLLSQNRIRFEVNLEATDEAGISLSSELLKVAIRVRRTGDH